MCSHAATAIAALRALDLPIEAPAYAAGIADARIPARLQAFERGGVAVLVDVGHNPQAADALASALAARPAAGRTIAVYAALGDKDHARVVGALAPVVDAWRLAGTLGAGARGLDAESLARRLAGTPAERAPRHDDIANALRAALDDATPGDRVLVFGSFHAAAAALQALNAA